MTIQLIGCAVLLACACSRFARQLTFAVVLCGIAVGAPLVATDMVRLPTLSSLGISLPFSLPF